ncbi:MAG TPA: dihydroorotase [Polyangiaceae bacterium]|jgi:dihydroorotase|nr:dihydroorotase [Polyangiaceae bacterium]
MSTQAFELLITGAQCHCPGGLVEVDVGIAGGQIRWLGRADASTKAERVLDARGLVVLPGIIDSQVHFREPGLEHKEDLESGTRAAVFGGVTTIFEMPNTNPNTDTRERLLDKLERARGRAHSNYAFFVGATAANADGLAELELLPGASGVKIFMGSSTGSLLVADDETLVRVLAHGRRRVAVHCEDEPRLIERKPLVASGAPVSMHHVWRDVETARLATERLLRAARRTLRPVHVLHVTTRDEMELLARNKDIATVEVTPQHLTLSAPDCYERIGSRAQMNPPIRESEHQAALWDAVRNGIVDVLGSDHAPHTLEEKAQPYPKSPSGMPGVQTMLPIMLDHVSKHRLSLGRLVDLLCEGPARIYNIRGKGRIAVGYDADLTLVDLKLRQRVVDADMQSKCGWTPFADMTLEGWPRTTVVGGQIVVHEGQLTTPGRGKPVRFWDVPDSQ